MNNLQAKDMLHNGRYTIVKMLGQGGFGITYLAWDNVQGRSVAIKEFFMKELCNRKGATRNVSVPSTGSRGIVDKFKKKFIKEAVTISHLSHPNIIKIYDIFEEHSTAYYVMQYIGGGSLGDLLKATPGHKLGEDAALGYIRQVGNALSYMHKLNINHLDIKPDNIMNDNGRAVLIDFGVAKRYDSDGHQTSTTPVGISHGYAPLEQYKQGGVSEFSPTTDVYSLGATLYKLLVGTTPPDANDVMESGLPGIDDKMPPSIAKAVKKAMNPKRAYRYKSIDDFLVALPHAAADSSDDIEIVEAVDEKGNTVIANKPQPQPSASAGSSASADSTSGGSANSSGTKGGDSDTSGCGIVVYVVLIIALIGYGIYMACNGIAIPGWYKALLIALCVSYKAWK